MFGQKVWTLLLALVLVMALVAGCAPAEEEPVEEPEEEAVENGDTWVVGTSADYPPFESVDEDGEFVGFDMDLVREVGARRGMEVEIVDMPFDSLIAALQEGQVDAVIASMSATPEREEQVDFTDPYHESMQAIVVDPESDAEINELDDILAYNFAVQTGTTMDEYATAKEEAGEVEGAVNRYTDAEAAALDVSQGRVDAFLVDMAVGYDRAEALDLEVAVEVKLEESGDPGIALPQGSDEELEEINAIIAELQEEGFIEQLVDQWLRGE